MKSVITTLIFVGLLFGLLMFTNPSAKTHKYHIYLAVKTQLNTHQSSLQNALTTDKRWGTFFELLLIKSLSNEYIIKLFIRTKLLKAIHKDYSLFSIITLQDDQKFSTATSHRIQRRNVFVSLGIFGRVFVNHRWYYQDNEIAILKFLTRLTPLSIAVMLILFAMSITTWYLIIVKALYLSFLRWQISHSAHCFWHTTSLETLKQKTDPFSRLAWHGMQASSHHKTQEVTHATTICSHSEFVTQALRYALIKNKIQLESGLTGLALVASTAPFIGLLGTVVGIYSALLAISVQKNVTIEIIAAPVGEALIMTAAGLAVAIPAVFAYNFFVRWQRQLFSRLESAAYELHTYLNTGARY